MNTLKWQWQEAANTSMRHALTILRRQTDYQTQDGIEEAAALLKIAALAEDRARRDGEEALL